MKIPKDFRKSSRKEITYICQCCGNEFTGSPSVSYKYPLQYYDISETERDARVLLQTSELSHLMLDDGEAFFIRCTIEVPIIGHDDGFLWGVWISQSKASFERYQESYDENAGLGSFGWLTVEDRYYRRNDGQSALEALACNVHWGQGRPTVVIKECNHPWYLDQKQGITWEIAMEIFKPYHTKS